MLTGISSAFYLWMSTVARYCESLGMTMFFLVSWKLMPNTCTKKSPKSKNNKFIINILHRNISIELTKRNEMTPINKLSKIFHFGKILLIDTTLIKQSLTIEKVDFLNNINQ